MYMTYFYTQNICVADKVTKGQLCDGEAIQDDVDGNAQ